MDKASLAFFSDTESPLTLLMKQNIEQADTMQTHLESRAPDHFLFQARVMWPPGHVEHTQNQGESKRSHSGGSSPTVSRLEN